MIRKLFVLPLAQDFAVGSEIFAVGSEIGPGFSPDNNAPINSSGFSRRDLISRA
jgi:hypothetical protein